MIDKVLPTIIYRKKFLNLIFFCNLKEEEVG